MPMVTSSSEKEASSSNGVKVSSPVHVAVPGNSSFVEGYALLARYGFSFGQKLGIECKGYFKGIDDAHVNFRFFHDA